MSTLGAGQRADRWAAAPAAAAASPSNHLSQAAYRAAPPWSARCKARPWPCNGFALNCTRRFHHASRMVQRSTRPSAKYRHGARRPLGASASPSTPIGASLSSRNWKTLRSPQRIGIPVILNARTGSIVMNQSVTVETLPCPRNLSVTISSSASEPASDSRRANGVTSKRNGGQGRERRLSWCRPHPPGDVVKR